MPTYHLSTYAQVQRVAPDSGGGSLWRPELSAAGRSNAARIATLETLYDFWIDNVYDPDGALARNPLFRQQLLEHPDVVSGMQVRESAVASMDDRIVPSPSAVDKAAAKRLAEYVQGQWSLIADRRSIYEEMQQAILWGGTCHEWIWWAAADGTQRPIKANRVDKSRVVFDRVGNMALLTRSSPVWGSYIKKAPGTDQQQDDGKLLDNLPKGKFSYHVYRREAGTWEQPGLEGYQYFGRGRDVDLYTVVTRDFAVWLQEMLWLEQYGRPPRILYMPTNTADWMAWGNNIANDLLTQQIVRVPKGISGDGSQKLFEVEQPQVPSPSFNAFGQARDRNAKQIDKILLMGAGLLDHGSSGGYSDHASRQQNGPDVLAILDAGRISSTVDQQVIPAIVMFGPPDLRNAPPTDWPKHTLTRARKDEPEEVTKLFEAAAKIAPVSLEEFYERTGLRKPKADDPHDRLFLGQQDDPMQQLQAGADPSQVAAPDREPGPAIPPGDEPPVPPGEPQMQTPIGQAEDEQ